MSYRLSIAPFIALCSASFLLTGCGFQPMLSGDTSQKQCFDLHIKGAEYATYKFRRELEKNLSYIPKFDDEIYKVDVVVAESRSVASQARNANITRKLSTLSATYAISKKGQPVGQASNTIVTSYPMTQSQEYVTRTAEVAASNRTAITLAEDVARDIVRLLKEPKKKV